MSYYLAFLQIRDATAVDIETINQEDDFLQLMQNCGEGRLLKVRNNHGIQNASLYLSTDFTFWSEVHFLI